MRPTTIAPLAACLTAASLTAAPPVITSFRTPTPAAQAGQTVTLNWEVAGAETLSIRLQIGTVSGVQSEDHQNMASPGSAVNRM